MAAFDSAADSPIRFDEHGLAPCIVQDATTGEVLMLAWVNAEAVERTRETGETHFWSRSRGELWHKGATSGNVQRVRSLRYDCDADALLAIVDPAGPACHTGERTCFYREVGGPASPEPDAPPADEPIAPQRFEVLPQLERVLDQRREEMPLASYTTRLLSDPPLIGAKVREEAEEVSRAAREESDDRVANEAADVIYHLDVLLASRGLALGDALDVLIERRRPR
ncbi:bifunctional phosphoribosyl-AMP cyclohydrolase/phosphoribosyl-ATP diphosphatase HisIE [Thermoleophilia bacterium SCSIO 60948]|nr:bifunctional phosphoribosyl-AMP cyclohydrolase/phosphoribosyl-ATP diphosphatase HisIE [Thermoleophilia bacterium SCSIO 60948]